jgi:hypothetical protein
MTYASNPDHATFSTSDIALAIQMKFRAFLPGDIQRNIELLYELL